MLAARDRLIGALRFFDLPQLVAEDRQELVAVAHVPFEAVEEILSALLDISPVLRRSIRLRNPYVDPMSLIQVELLRRKQQGQKSSELEYPLGATINGIAAGLHNTG